MLKYHGTAQTGGGTLNAVFSTDEKAIMVCENDMFFYAVADLPLLMRCLFEDTDEDFPPIIGSVDAIYREDGDASIYTIGDYQIEFSGAVEVYRHVPLMSRCPSRTYGDIVTEPIAVDKN